MSFLAKFFRSDAPTSVADLKKTRAEIDVTATEAAVSKAATARRQALLVGDDAEVEKAETALSQANLALDRARVAAEEIDLRIAAAEKAEALAAWRKQRADAEAACANAAAQIKARYPDLTRQLSDLLRAARAADEKASAWMLTTATPLEGATSEDFMLITSVERRLFGDGLRSLLGETVVPAIDGAPGFNDRHEASPFKFAKGAA